LHMAQLMPRPLTVSCFSKIQIGFTFPVPADPGSPGKRAVRRVCVFVVNPDAGDVGVTPFYCNSGFASESASKLGSLDSRIRIRIRALIGRFH